MARRNDDMDTQMNDQGLPLNWYGMQNYLGKPVSIAVQGETPTGSSQGAPAALAAGGSGPTASPGKGSVTGSAVPGKSNAPINGSSNTIQSIMNGLGYAGMGAQGVSGGLDLAKIMGPKDIAKGSAEETGLKSAEGLGEKAATEGAAGGAEAGSDLTLTGALGPVGLAALLGQGINIGGQYAGNALFKKSPHANEAFQTAVDFSNPASAVAEGISGLSDLFTGNIKGFMNEAPIRFAEDALHNPVGMVKDMWNGLFGAPPAFAFPQQSLEGITKQINDSLPKEITPPQGATPEQQAAVTKANDIIKQIGKYRDSLPARFNSLGNQSAQSWQYELNNATNPYLQSQFAQLKPAYEAAIASFNQVPKVETSSKPMNTQKTISPKETTDGKGDKVLGNSFYKGKQKDDVQS